MPSAEQSQIRIGWVGVPRSTPDYFALQVLNTVLGGSFTSRLNQNLREEHGYSYGASSRFDMRLSAGAVPGGRGRADRQDRRGAEGVLQGAERHRRADRAPRSWPRRRTTWRWDSRASSRPSATCPRASRRWWSTSCPTATTPNTWPGCRRSPPPTSRRPRPPTSSPASSSVVVVGDREGDRAGHPRAEPGTGSRAVGGRGAAMSVALTLTELLDYSDYERAKWKAWVQADPARLNTAVSGGRALSDPVEPAGAHLPGGAPAPGAPGRRHAARQHGRRGRRLGGALRVRGPGEGRPAPVRRRPRPTPRPATTFTFADSDGHVHDEPPQAGLAHRAPRDAALGAGGLRRAPAAVEPPGEHDLFFFPEIA